MTEQTKAIWPGWETVRVIGKGGFGSVYEIQRDVYGEVEKAALKVITIPRDESDLEDLYGDGYDHDSIADTFKSHLKSILVEYSLMRKMNGTANIVSCDDVHYIQHDDGIGWDIFIKMELLTPLTRSLPLKIPENTVVKVARDMCAALELCRKHEIVHRDIKPQNIFLSPNGDYKLGDFGIARTMEKTMGGTKIGTFAYMAPEVYNNQPYGTTADIYSLGLVLYWMLNERRLPFLPLPPAASTVEDNEKTRLRRFAGEAIPAPRWGSEALKRIVLKACTFDPEARYQTAQEMLDDLEKLGQPAGTEDDEHTAVLFGGKHGGQSGKGNEDTVYLFNHPGKGKTTQSSGTQSTGSQTEDSGNASEDEDKKRTGLIAAIVCLAILAVLAAALAACYFTLHIWSTATCTEPAECKICGKIREAAPGHQWIDATCQTPKTCEVCEETKGEPASHQWQDATCTDPRICAACEETEGEPLDHQWQEATCTAPETCSGCGITVGAALEHQWAEATYDEPKTCELCGETEGTTLGYPLAYCRVIETSEYEEDVGFGLWVDTHGGQHPDSIRFWVVERKKWHDTEEVVLGLDQRFLTLSGTISCETSSERGASVSILIYNDGTGELLYESVTVYYESEPLAFTVDVTGVDSLRVVCTTDSSAFGYGIVDALLYR